MAVLLAAALARAEQPDVPRDAPGAWADPARTVFLVPGARTLLSGFDAVSFDGLPPASSTVWFDGVPLRAPAHALFGPGALPAAWVDGVHVSAGVEPASRGRALSRSVELLPRAAPDDAFHAVARLDVLQLGLSGEGVVPATKTRVQLAGRFFGIPALVTRFLGITALLGDWQARLTQPIGDGELRLLVLGLMDLAALKVSGIPLEARLGSHHADLRWRSGGFELGLRGSQESIGLSLNGAQTSNRIDAVEQTLELRASVRREVGAATLVQVGGDVSLHRLWLGQTVVTHPPAVDGAPTPAQTSADPRTLGTAALGGVWGSLRMDEGPWRWTIGARADLWSPMDARPYATADPRLSVERRLGDTATVGLALGVQHQPASWLVSVPVLETASLKAGVQEAARVEASAGWSPVAGQRVALRVWGIALLRTLELSPFDADFLQAVKMTDENLARHVGHGWAAGGELSWRLVDTERWWGQAAYSLQQSWRTAAIDHFGANGLPLSQSTASVPWSYQQAHALSVAGGWRGGGGWALSVSATLQSGPPMAGGLFSQQQQQGVDALRGTPRWVPVDRDRVGFVGPWFHLDARASKTWRPAPLEVELYLDVQTLSIWAQPTGVSYGVAPASLEAQARGDVTLTTKPASSPIPGPIPVLGVELRL